MTDFQSGRVTGTFNVGSKVEDLKDTYENEAKALESMKISLLLAVKSLELYVNEIDADLKGARIPVKEAEYGRKYVKKCVDIVVGLFNETEGKRLKAIGAVEAMIQATGSIKRLYDEEKDKLDRHIAWENDPDRKAIDRPVGAEQLDPPKPVKGKRKGLSKA